MNRNIWLAFLMVAAVVRAVDAAPARHGDRGIDGRPLTPSLSPSDGERVSAGRVREHSTSSSRFPVSELLKPLWEIGQADGGNAEFALAPKDYGQFAEDGFFIVGRSAAARDWPYVHPGPSDSWAGGREHTFTIVFGVKRTPREGACRLLLDLLDTHSRAAPRLRVEINGQPFELSLPNGGGDASIGGKLADAKPHHATVEFPASLLRAGNNRIALVNAQGSWCLYDRVALETPAAVEAIAVANPSKLGRPLPPKPAQIEQVVVVFKTHFDIGYTDMASNVVARYRTTMIDKALEVVDQNRDLPPAQQFAWTIPGWPMHQILDWPEQTPERKQRVMQAFKDGRFVVHALPFSMHTELLELEDLVRGLGHASKLARAAGLQLPRDAKMTDVPCHAWLLPTLLKRAGVDFLHLGCNSASSSPRVPALFWWEGPDGSRLLTYYSAGGYGSGLMPPAGWPHKTWLALIHTGDNHGPPTPDEVKKLLDQAAKQLPGVKVRIGRLSDFADAVLAERPKLPVVRADMPDTWIHGPMCDPAGAAMARNVRPAIATTETLGVVLRAWGAKVPDTAATISAAYESSLLYGEHTWGGALYWITKYGGGAKFGYGEVWKADHAQGRFQRLEDSWAEHTAYIEKARDLISPVLRNELESLATAVCAEGKRVVVFNPLPWKRDGLVIARSLDAAVSALKPVDGGDAVPAASSGRVMRFVARDVPAMGYRSYVPVKAEIASTVLATDAQAGTIENSFLRVILDPASGTIRSLVDKRTGRELATTGGPHGLGQYLYERFSANETTRFVNAYGKQKTEWFIAEFGKPNLPPASEAPYRAVSPRNFKLRVEQTPVAVTAVMEAAAGAELPHAVTTRVTLLRDQPWLELAVTLHDKPADPWPEAGWICLPVKAEKPQFRIGRQAAIVDPVRDIVAGANRHLFGVNSGFTITDAQGCGVGFCALDHPLVSLGEPGCWNYSLDYLPQKPAAYVNLFNNQWTTNFRYWNSGTWTSRVRLWPVKSRAADAALVTPSLEARSPLLAAVADGAPGTLPPVQRGLELSRKGVQVTAFGDNPDGEGTVLRVWELAGKSGSCRVSLPPEFKVSSVQPVDLRGEPAGKTLAVRNSAFTIELKAFAPASFVFETKGRQGNGARQAAE